MQCVHWLGNIMAFNIYAQPVKLKEIIRIEM